MRERIGNAYMKYFPALLDIRNKTAIVFGGGEVAERKCLSLVQAGARIRVVSPELVPGIAKLASEGRLEYLRREYRKGDVAEAFLVFAATDRLEVNRAIAAEAALHGVPVNIADCPGMSSFISPAIVARGDLLITVSTGGTSPALAGKIREELEDRFGIEYDKTLRLLGAVREKLLTVNRGSQYNKKLFSRLVSHDLPGLLKNKSFDEIDRLLQEIFGPEFTLDNLGEEIRDPA
jgi:precorrin-2 dehydrogenase/sirohydrochlorin ferrochelatase